MDLKLFITIFFAGILLFGCIGGSTPPTNTGSTGPNAQSDNPQTTTANGGTPTTTGSVQGSSTGDLTGKVWSELIALGTSVECTLKYKDASLMPGFEKATLYMKGSKFKETLTMSQAGQSITMTVISKGDGFMYIVYDSAMMAVMTQGKIACDGIKTEINMSDTSSSSTTVDTSAFEDTNKVELDCKPALFGDEMFQVTGKYCTMKEITTALTGGVDPCAQIEDATAKAQCQAALGG